MAFRSDARPPRIVASVVFGCAVACTTQVPSRSELSFDETARVLAGLATLDSRSPPATSLSLDNYRRDVENSWAFFETRRGRAMWEWAANVVKGAHGETIFYPFGGPDFDSVHRMYPNATRYVLVALEKADSPPDLTVDDAQLLQILNYYRLATSQFAMQGYYAEVSLRDHFEEPVGYISGVLLLMAARAGYEVRAVEPIRLSEQGQLSVQDLESRDPDLWSSIRLTLLRDDGATVIVDYVRFDLADENVQATEGARQWLQRMAQNDVFLKAAGHLMQLEGEDASGYTILREAILHQATSVLQDETGLGYPELAEAFEVQLFGSFTEASRINTHAEGDSGFTSAVRALVEAYAENDGIQPLGFLIGYTKPSGSCLLYAHQRRG